MLASGSPRRSELLARTGLAFDVIPAGVDERAPYPGEDPCAYAIQLAREKAQSVALEHADALVLGADTVVALPTTIFGKPVSTEDAVAMLSRLSGRDHMVVTGVAVVWRGQTVTRALSARVSMRPAHHEEIWSYVASGEPMDKAGAYAVQGRGSAFVQQVDGCYLTVVGLPLCLVASHLREVGCSVAIKEWCDACVRLRL
ncbi:MAG: Maf family nucleotide pyrophosphatase [Chloroflexota bacterium]